MLLRTVGGLLRNGRFIGYSLTQALSFMVILAFMAGAPFLLQTRLGMTPVEYAVTTAVIVGLMGILLVGVTRMLGRMPRGPP